MKKIKAFAYVFQNSLISPAYYRDIVKTPFSFSLKYFLTLAVLMSVLTAVFIAPSIRADVKSGLTNILDAGATIYPEELVVTIKEGKLSINQPEPYVVPVPAEWTKFLQEEVNDAGDAKEVQKMPANLVVFDTAGTLNDLAKYDTLVLVNEVNILVSNTFEENPETKAIPLAEIPDAVINQTLIITAIESMRPIVGYIVWGVVAAVFLWVFMSNFTFKFISFLFIGLALLIVGKIRGLSLSYSKYLKVAMHAGTLAFVVGLVFVVAKTVGLTVVDEVKQAIPYWFGAITFLYGLVVVIQLAKGSEVGEGVGEEKKFEEPVTQTENPPAPPEAPPPSE